MMNWPLFFAGLFSLTDFKGQPDVKTIVQRSSEAIQTDWNLAPTYNYCERDLDKQGLRTYQVMMIYGSPYKRLVAVNGKPLRKEDEQREQRKLDQTFTRRRSESTGQAEQRIAGYEKERTRDHRLIEELTKAFTFKLLGERTVDTHQTYVLQATPRSDYRPSDKETEILTGMHGKLWIDKASFQWVKVEAEVIHTVSIVGFLARVEPGTRFELDKAPVPGGIWLPRHFSVRSQARIVSFIHYKTHEEDFYFGYQKANSPSETSPMSGNCGSQ